ncbi:MAG: four helix bundle protein [Cytophagales bacterium]|nr:four helix bundle protein [Cytophagales bacterium]
MHNFKELKIWQSGIEIAKTIYKLTSHFPQEEKYGLISQIRRCSISIPSNIAEGSGRSSAKDFSHFLSISLSSSFELETQLILASELKFLKEDDYNSITEQLTVCKDDLSIP